MENKQFEELEDDDLSMVSGGAGQIGFLLNVLTESQIMKKNLNSINRMASKYGVTFAAGEEGRIRLSLNGKDASFAEVTDYLKNMKS